MSLLKLFATLAVLLMGQTGPAPAEPPKPSVGVPFGCGLTFEVSQAHNVGSHQHNDSWAWDFRMPEGVPIVSARSGVVRMARGDSTTGGCDPKFAKDANYVVVDHGDGTEAQYLHFSSVAVEAGQKVNQGELLGYSGKTGWACGSHLHFKLARRVHNGWNNPSLPAVIEGYGDPEARTVIHAPACSPRTPTVIQAEAEPSSDPSFSTGASAAPQNDVVPARARPTRSAPVVVPAAADHASGGPTPGALDVAPAPPVGYGADRATAPASGNAAR